MEELAGKVGMSKQYISVLERGAPHALTGKAVTPSVEKIEAIAKALGADLDEGLAAAGYAGQVAGYEIQVADGVRVKMQKDYSPEDRNRFEIAFRSAYETAKRMIEESEK